MTIAGMSELRPVAKTPEDVQKAKLVDASQQFEAMMLGEMLKPLQFGASPDAGADESGGGAGDTIRGIANDALGKALAQHGGVGIARSVLAQVQAEGDARHKSVEQKETGTKVR